MLSEPSVLKFSLADVPERDRTITLREVFGRGIVNMDFTPLTNNPRMEVHIRLLPGVAITSGWNSPHLAESAYDRSRENDDFALVWGTAPGKGRLQHLGKEAIGDHGSAILISCADPVRAETQSSFRHLTVRLRRSMLRALLPNPEAALMRPVAPDNRALRLLTLYLAALDDSNFEGGPELAYAVGQHICDLVALAIDDVDIDTRQPAERGVRAARLAVIKRWAIARVDSQDLSIASAAAAAGISPRYVQRLFQSEGSTFTAYVLTRRLALAHRRLSNPTLAGRTIGEIAFASGFGDLSYFDRTFRATFGETPSDVRQRALRDFD